MSSTISPSSPLVSIVMSAYNAQDTITEAIESLLQQTYTTFELIIINDGSTDKTEEILQQLSNKDKRIIVINQANIGLTKSLNRGIQLAKGKYIARQDADDHSYPLRLEQQVKLMENNPDVVLCGANCDNVFINGQIGKWGWKDDKTLVNSLRFKTPFAHSTAFFRTEIAKALGGYNENYQTTQDMEFWIRLSSQGCVTMIESPLIRRHILKESVSIKRRWRQHHDAFRARWTHNKNQPLAVIYHSLRSLLISFLPDRAIATIQFHKNKNL